MQCTIVFTIFLLVQCSAMAIAEASNKQALCDVDGIHAEILKAIRILKKIQGEPVNKTAGVEPGVTIGAVRQDGDDDDEIPYYVPAIAKVIGSVLAQNATSVIEESLGFIPPEVNKNIQYVLGLVAETVQKLKPAEPTTTPVPVKIVQDHQQGITSGGNITEEEQVAQIEAFLAFALAQEIGASIGANISAFPRPGSSSTTNSDAFPSPPLTPFVDESEVTTKPLAVVDTVSDVQLPVESVLELFSSTFKSFDVKAVNSDRVSSEGGLAIYAPNYAPNYVAATTNIPVYASAYDHHSFMVSTPPTASPLKLVVTKQVEDANTSNESVTDPAEEVTETSQSTTTEDDDDDYEDNDY